MSQFFSALNNNIFSRWFKHVKEKWQEITKITMGKRKERNCLKVPWANLGSPEYDQVSLLLGAMKSRTLNSTLQNACFCDFTHRTPSFINISWAPARWLSQWSQTVWVPSPEATCKTVLMTVIPAPALQPQKGGANSTIRRETAIKQGLRGGAGEVARWLLLLLQRTWTPVQHLH